MSVARVNRRFCRSCAGCRSTGRRPTVNALSAVLTAAGGAALPGAVAALADTKDAAPAVRGELLLRRDCQGFRVLPVMREGEEDPHGPTESSGDPG
jgi:hypothetical protein